jgi:lipopolysaccharide/colanic/teichoic acid biosynthesis glycosyltransferase
MSLVGPRPESPVWVARYTPEQRSVLSVKPGITGLAQVKYRSEESLLSGQNLEQEYLEIMEDKLSIDLNYVEASSFFLDLLVLIDTAKALVWSA